jgi:hypothetical protein
MQLANTIKNIFGKRFQNNLKRLYHLMNFEQNGSTMNPEATDAKQTAHPVRSVVLTLLVGVGGNVVVFIFLLTFLHIIAAIKFIPWIIAFNTAVAGYSLIDKTRDHLKYSKTVSALAGCLNALITSGIITAVSIYSFGEQLLNIRDISLFVVVGLICSVLGTILAVKYFKLQRNQ